MTAVESYRSAPLEFLSDAPSTAQRTRYVPPAVPSPPSTSTRYSPPPRKRSLTKSNIINMTTDDASQWLFTEAELASTPSVLDGLGIAEERCRRAKGVNFIIQAGILLKLPQLTLATASVFFHRFYMRQSMVPEKGGYHHYLPRSKSHAVRMSGDTKITADSWEQTIAATSLFLATKTEENCRKTKEIVIAVAKVAQKNASLIIDEQSKEYWRWRDSILLHEELILELLTFDVVLRSPYTFLYDYVRKLQVDDNKQMRNCAWAFINDSCLTMMCLLVPPQHIAIAAIYFAAKFNKERIPDNENDISWWEQIDGTAELICKAVNVMNEFYNENPLRKENPYGQSPMSISQDDIDMTRSGYSGGTPGSERALNSQNGHGENGETQTPNGTSKDEKEEFLAKHDPGSSDKQLKEIANDPATHRDDSHPNGMSEIITSTEISTKGQRSESPKRKLKDGGVETVAKKVKIEPSSGTEHTFLSVDNLSKPDPAKEEGSEDGEEEGEVAE